VTNLFDAFDRIVAHGVAAVSIPAGFGDEGSYFRLGHHFVYWRRLSGGDIGIVTILHERIHQTERFRDERPC
jgi:toxin ParE1/3/4